MSIDWFTFAAQVVNFLILAALLWRFLFRPIVKVMNERERDIAASLETAAEKVRLAEQQAAELETRRAESDAQRRRLLAEAEAQAAAAGQRLREEARIEIEGHQQRWLDAFEQRKAALAVEFRRQLSELICSATRSALTDLASQELESSMVDRFLVRLDQLEPGQVRQMRESAAHPVDGLTVRTAFDLRPELRTRLDRRLRELLPDAPAAKFERSPEGVCGIELSAGDRRLAWNVDAYLEHLQQDLDVAEATGAVHGPDTVRVG